MKGGRKKRLRKQKERKKVTIRSGDKTRICPRRTAKAEKDNRFHNPGLSPLDRGLLSLPVVKTRLFCLLGRADDVPT